MKYTRSNVLMVDIETTGQNVGCKVLTLGAFGISKRGQECEFYVRFDLEELEKAGFSDDRATIEWWQKKPAEVYTEAFGGKTKPVEGIADFKRFCYENFDMGRYDRFQVWCCGLDFDFPILKEFFRRYGFCLSWNFWDQYDYRTIKNLFETKKAEQNSQAHNALEDCKAQMRGLQDFFRRAGF